MSDPINVDALSETILEALAERLNERDEDVRAALVGIAEDEAVEDCVSEISDTILAAVSEALNVTLAAIIATVGEDAAHRVVAKIPDIIKNSTATEGEA